ncbi:MAG: ArsR family transcriptional regulator [Methanothermobacter sp.]|nr:ArsR family transcriptional regulator [Methanothermobacter sp.]
MKKRNQFTIFSTETGIEVIKSTVKSLILSELKRRELSFQDIVKITGRSKSTVSKHLSDLRKMGLIVEMPDPEDRRRKLFRINSKYLGKLTRNRIDDLDEEKTEFLAEHLTRRGDPLEFFRLMFHVLRVELIKEGIDIDPVLHEAGKRIGQVIYQRIASEDLEDLLENLKKFWMINCLGVLEVESTEPLVIRDYDCFECRFLPQIGKSTCALDSGILEAIFSQYFKREVLVEETECYARGDGRCSFRITP